jgi:putative oxidoreductase
VVGVLEVAGAVGLLIPLVSSLAALRLAAVMVGAAMTTQFLLEESRGCPWPSW